jgi:hypothetical protein
LTLSASFFDKVKYKSSDFRNRDADFFGSGVVHLTDFPITFNGNMTVNIGEGVAWVSGGFRISNDNNPITLTFAPADPVNPRIDIIQIGINSSVDANGDTTGTPVLQVKQGIASPSPIEPGPDNGYVKLYAVNIAPNQTSITSANVIDRRSLVPLNVDGSQISNFNGATTSYVNAVFADLFGNTSVVLSGGVATKNGTVPNQLDVTAANVYFAGGQHVNFPTSQNGQFTTSTPNTTYYLDYNSDGTTSWGTSHSVKSGYVTICQVTTDGSGNISTVTDKRPTAINLLSGATGAIKTKNNTLDDGTGKATFAGQITSQVATGTSPFSVSSTTKVTNLNSDLVDGYHADTGTTANTIPVRDANGLIPFVLNPSYGFRNLLETAKQSFTRATNAARKNLDPVGINVLRTELGKFGQGAFIEEASTNLVYNSDFETVTGTKTVFSDVLTSYTGSLSTAGSTMGPWTLQRGTVTFGASGVVFTSGTDAVISAGNNIWSPIPNLPITAVASNASGTSGLEVGFLKDANNYIFAFLDVGNKLLKIGRQLAGSYSQLASSSTLSITAGNIYTISLSIDTAGNLTAKLYSGVGTGGTLISTVTATDTNFLSGLSIMVGGNSNSTINNAYVTAPFPDGWTIGGDTRIAWALTNTNPISGSYSVSAVGVASASGSMYPSSTFPSVAPSTSYTLSGFVSTTNAGANGGGVRFSWYNGGSYLNSVDSTPVTGTQAAQRVVNTATSPSNATSCAPVFYVKDSGTYVFDAIQLEQKPYATTYIRNDSTSQTATRNADSLSYTLSQPLPSRWFGALVWKPNMGSSLFTTPRSLFSAQNMNAANVYRYNVRYNANGQFDFYKSADGVTLYNVTSTAISFNANDTVFVAFMDDPISGYMYLWVGINGGTLQQFSTANTVQVTDATTVRVGCFYTAGSECNGTIDFPIITDIIPTSAQVQALYQASDWGGIRNWPTVLTANQQAWIAPTLLNGWTVYSDVNGTYNVGYMKDSLGFVHIKGTIKGGTTTGGTTLFTLPSGYRPSQPATFPTISNSNSSGFTAVLNNVSIKPTGEVYLPNPGSGNVWLALDGITFRAEQ